MNKKYKKGFSTTNLWYFRQFYLTYSKRQPLILHKPCGELLYEEKLDDENHHDIWTDGEVYEGDWVDGNMHGYGTKWYADGNKYTGKWENDKRLN